MNRPTESHEISNDAAKALNSRDSLAGDQAQRRTPNRLGHSDEHFRSVAESGVVAIAFFDLAGAITDANDEFLRMLRFTRDDLTAGRVRWDRLTPPEWMPRTRAAVEEYKHTGRIEPYEKEYFRADGERFWGLFAGRRIESTGAGVAIVLDITERKRAEQALREADRRKDEFLAILAHELRNPLAPITTAVGILQSEDVPEPMRARSRDIIQRQVAHMTRLIDDLLDVSRLTSGKVSLQRAPVRLDQVLDAAIETARPTIEAQAHRLQQRRPPAAVWLDGDLARLSQVFANLLNNAAKYTPRNGMLWIDVSDHPGRVTVRVTDTGQGIAADRLDAIFDLFAQGSGSSSSAPVGGLGIGLALARRFVELHGGALTASSPGDGHGATFTVTLPTIQPAEYVPEHTERALTTRSLRRRVLVVDDSQDAADTNVTFLELAGCVTRAVYAGEDVITEVIAFKPDVVLLDIGMPGVSGLDVCRQIRALPEGKALTIVAITGWAQDDDRRRTREAGFDAHLVKPVAPEALLQAIEQAK